MSSGNVAATEYADTSGPNASMEFGEATRQKELQRQAGVFALGGSQLPNATRQPRLTPEQGPQPQQQAAQPPAGPLDAFRGPGGQLDMQRLFPPLPQPKSPFRDRLRMWGAHPAAGRRLRDLAAMADKQRGPLDASRPE